MHLPRRLLILFWIFAGFCTLRGDTVLVLPFFNQSNSQNLDWIGESISEAVRESLISGGVLALDRVYNSNPITSLGYRYVSANTGSHPVPLSQFTPTASSNFTSNNQLSIQGSTYD